MTCTVTDDNAVDRVLMPTWSENNGQDDLIWYTANRTGNTYTIEVDMMNHNYDTVRLILIYMLTMMRVNIVNLNWIQKLKKIKHLL